jgi:hypothetical protein
MHPWNGRNCCLGLEDVCGFFAEGLARSLGSNLLTKAGIPTAVRLSPEAPTVVNYIQGVVKTPAGFGHVREVEFGAGKVTFHAAGRKKVTAPVCHEFIRTGHLD